METFYAEIQEITTDMPEWAAMLGKPPCEGHMACIERKSAHVSMTSWGMVVCKMAAVGCLRDNGTMEGDESSEKEGLELMKMCRKNGIHQDCFMGENARDSLDSRPTKTERSPRLNGSSKSVSAIFTKPSIPTLRSRKDKISPELGRRRRRPSKGENLELRIRCCTQDGGRSLGLGDAAADGPPTLYKLDLGCEAKAGLRCGTGVGSCLCHHSSTQEVCVSASPPDLQPHRGGGAAEDAAWKKERDCGKSEEMGGYDTPDSPLHCPSPPPPRACTPMPFPTPALGTDSSPHLLTGGGGSSNSSASSLSSFSSLPSSCPSSLLSSIISPSASLASLFGVSRALEPQHHHYHNNNNHHYHHLNNHHNHHHHTNNNLLHLHHHHHHYPPHPLEPSSLIGSKDKGSNSNNSSSNINSSSNDAAKDGQTSLSSSSSGAASLGGITSATTAAPSSSNGTTSSEPSPASAAAAEETAVACQWKSCGAEVSPADLLEHLRHVHVDTQSGGETFVCQWAGCKVVGKASCSMSWLERHVVTHSGHKPYKCILPHCGARFPSQAALHRHVNAHFVTQGPAAASRSSRPRGEEASARLLRKRNKLRRRRPQCVRNGDFFDSGVMDQLRQQLWDIAHNTQLDLGSGSSQHLTFHSSVIARRMDESGKVNVLLHWHPEDVLDDSWVPLSQVSSLRQRVIPISQLPPSSAANIHPTVYRQHRFRKHRRK